MNNEKRYPKTLVEAVTYFSNPDVALEFFIPYRWPGGIITCPHCGRNDAAYLEQQHRWQCKGKHPRKQFSAKVGTIFEDSPLSLEKWLVALWLEVNAKNSISSYEVHRALGVTQKTAWFMQQRVRLAMQDKRFQKMSGAIEADETYVGGKARNMHKHVSARKITGTGGAGRTIVMGLLELHCKKGKSRIRAKVTSHTRKNTVQSEVRDCVQPGSTV